jgi:hypothetical protein
VVLGVKDKQELMKIGQKLDDAGLKYRMWVEQVCVCVKERERARARVRLRVCVCVCARARARACVGARVSASTARREIVVEHTTGNHSHRRPPIPH